MRNNSEIHRARRDPVNGDAAGNGYVSYSVTDSLQIRDYLRIVYRRRWMIVGLLVAGVLAGVLHNWTTTPIYEARATLQMDMDLNVLGLERPLVPVDQRDWMREFLPTQLGILESRELARLAHEELKGLGGSTPRGTQGINANERALGPRPEASDTDAPTVTEIVKGRTVSLVRDTRLVNIGFRGDDPVRAARVANALARAYVQQNVKFRSRTTTDASDWLSKQVAQQRTLVDESEAVLQRYRKEQGADALITNRLGTQQQNIVVQKLAELQSAVTRAKGETIEKEAQYRQLSAIEGKGEPLDTLQAIASNSFIQGLKGELAALQRQLVQESKELGERHPDIIKLQGVLQNAERKLQAETATVVRTIRNEFETAQAREREMVSALERQRAEVQTLNGKAVEYTGLEREATSNREVLDMLLQRSRQATLERQLQSTNVRIVDTADVPERPILPRKERTLILTVAASGALALVLVFVLEIFNTRVSSPDDVKRHLQIPVLGVTPQVKALNGRASLLLGNGAPPEFAELFQAVRTNVLLAPELAAGRILLVTSSEPAEGKTVAAANLAMSLARLKQRVLLIDADLRRPQLHEMFGEQREPGLADVLKGKTSPGDLRRTKLSNLWLMPAGSSVSNPADLLGSDRFNKVIEYLRKQFDWIVLDSPPVLAVTDPCVIARVASGVLLVVHCDRTSRNLASAAVERLDAVGANVLGAMLNRVVLRRGGEYLPYYSRDYRYLSGFRPRPRGQLLAT